jgi:DNA-binding response OmpR family regulator
VPGWTDCRLLGEIIAAVFSNLPVMMVTACGDDERRRLAGEYGAAEFITKPVDFDFLKTQLRDLSDAAD